MLPIQGWSCDPELFRPARFASAWDRSNTSNVSVRTRGTHHRTLATQRGFTLVELMTVVTITGILATLGFASLRDRVSAAWGAEALNMVQSIRAAEERWRSEHMMYLDVSGAGATWYPVDATLPANRGKQQAFFAAPGDTVRPNSALWLQLRPTVAGPVRFGYMVNAGLAGATMTTPSGGPSITWPTPPDNWYVIQARGDTDGDGVISYYRASSLSGDVFTQNHGE
jgi:prepilin-type N-terminal cleavage/methylation domain-containing protein